jgi:surface antigen
MNFLLTSINATRQPRASMSRFLHCAEHEMSTPVKAAVLIAALFPFLPAQAQYLGLGLETNIELTRQDIEMIHRTVDTEVHGKAVGTTAKWSSPDSRNYGKIELLKKFVQNGQPCETVEYTLGTKRRPLRPEHYVLNSCLQPDGQWRMI